MKYKARLIIIGQKEHDIQDESFSPVADNTIATILIYMSLQQGWEMNHSDFTNAFRIGRLNRAMYVRLPKYMHCDD